LVFHTVATARYLVAPVSLSYSTLSALALHLTTSFHPHIRRFGPLGLGAWILRDDVKDAVNVVLRLMDAVPGVSMKDLAGGLYYLFTLRKGEQGCRPDAPAEEHSGCADVRLTVLAKGRTIDFDAFSRRMG
jgi:hypothetical protein